MKYYLHTLIMILLITISSLVAGCTKGNFEPLSESNGGTDSAEFTYCNLTLSLNSKGETPTRAVGDDGSTADERKITNLTLMFFDAKTLKLEASASFTGLVSAGEDKYKLKSPMQATAGRKKVVALANVPTSLKSRLVAIKSYDEIRNFLLTTHQTSDYLKELGVTSGNYGDPNNGPHEFVMKVDNGLLMTGECDANLIAGVTESEAMAGLKNNISDIYVDRAAVKIKVIVEKEFYTKLRAAYPLLAQTLNVNSPTIQIRNLPQHSFLLPRGGGMSPYYNSSEFTNWNKRSPYLYMGSSSNAADKAITAYVPENTFSTAYQGNATNIIVSFRVGSGDGGGYTFFVFYDQAKNKTFLYSGPYVNASYNSALSYVTTFFNKNAVDYMEGETLKKALVMPTNIRTKAAQDTELLAQLGTTTVAAGYYLFIYRADPKDLESEVWYDEMQLYKYTGNGMERVNRWDFKSAYYNTNIHFRINLADVLLDESSNKRYSIHRNTAFTINIKGVKTPTGSGFEVPGYPERDDLGRRPGDKLTELGMGLDIAVDQWSFGGGTNVDIED